jgi:serine/threonine protein kinase
MVVPVAPPSSATLGAAARPDVLPGAIDGHPVLSLLGSGGMGSVYLAYDPLMDRQVALKVLTPSLDDAQQARNAARFLSEAVLTGRLGHAGIVPIYRVGFDERAGYYYAMRYVKGRTLGDIEEGLAAGDPLVAEQYTLRRLLSVFLRACEALAFAHRNSIVHRDVKPANIIVAEFGEVLVLDWGLAKDTRAEKPAASEEFPGMRSKLDEARQRHSVAAQILLSKQRLSLTNTTYLRRLQAMRPSGLQTQKITGAQQVLGTPGYLSPEQGEGREVTAASDVYSLGATLYELLTHSLPVSGESREDLVLNTVLGKVEPLQSRPESARLPRQLCEMVTRALALKAEDRYQDAGELVEELTLYLEGRGAWRKIAGSSGKGAVPAATAAPGPAKECWDVVAGNIAQNAEGLTLPRESRMRCAHPALGDFRAQLEFWAQSDGNPWTVALLVQEVEAARDAAPRYQMRLGVEERPFVELLRNGQRIQRRLDLRLQSGQWYAVKIEMEQETLRLWMGSRKYLEYHEVFPQTGGRIEIAAQQGSIGVRNFALQSRGAPLSLSFMALPDRLFHDKKYAEAREFYRRLAASHPDREEGLSARFKAGLCSTLKGDLQDAFQEFMQLENTMYDHCCALGLAEIGMLDGNIEWAWEALKNGHRRHHSQDIRSELWFALLNMVEHLPPDRHAEKIARYGELLAETRAAPEEAGRVASELLELLRKHRAAAETRKEAVQLLQACPENAYVVQEALFALSRVGLDESILGAVTPALDRTIRRYGPDVAAARLHILRAEVAVASGETELALSHLKDAVVLAGLDSPDGIWARQWQILLRLLSGQHQAAMLELHETLVRLRQLRPGQLSYYRVLEALGYLCRGKTANAASSMGRAAADESMWGRAAHHWALRQPASELAATLAVQDCAKIAEAAFLLGEAHRLGGEEKLAGEHYGLCLQPAYERALFTHLARARLAHLAVPTPSA